MGYKRKRLGQHFLKSSTIARRIVDSLDIKPSDTIIEIGPGKGMLTGELIKTNGRIIAVEIEAGLAELLKHKFPCDNLTVYNVDFLRFDISKYSGTRIIGNIPYKISTPLIGKLIEDQCHWKLAVLTFQREFAARLLAKPKTKTFGSLSVFFQYHFNGEKLFDIPARAFAPPPKVRSTVLRIKSKHKKINKGFQRFVQMVFSKRRKMLRSILKGYDVPIYYTKKRPEEISTASLFKLYQHCCS